jgi:tetratricopeptide (TPR) repeat protein
MDHLTELERLEHALAAAVKAKDDQRRAGVLLSLALLHAEAGRPKAAARTWTEADALCAAIGETGGLAEAAMHLGSRALDAADFQAAAELFMKAVHCGGLDPGDHALLARVNHNLGVCHSNLGASSMAIAAFEDALGHWRAGDNTSERARTLLALGESLSSAGHHGRAVETLEEALVALPHKDASGADRALALELLAGSLLELDRVAEGLDRFGQAAEAWGDAGAADHRLRCRLRELLVLLGGGGSGSERIVRALRVAIGEADQGGDAEAAAFARWHLATALSDEGDHGGAADVLLRLATDTDRADSGRARGLRHWAARLIRQEAESLQGGPRRGALGRAQRLFDEVGDTAAANVCRWAIAAEQRAVGDHAALAQTLAVLESQEDASELVALAATHRVFALGSLRDFEGAKTAARTAMAALGDRYPEYRDALEKLADALDD